MEQDECHIMLFTCDEGIDPRPEQCWVWWVTSASSGAVVSTKNREKTVSAEQTMITLLSIDVSIVLMLVKMISRKWLPSLVRCVLISRMCVWYQVSVIVELCYLSDNTRVPQSILIVHWFWFESKFSEVLGWVWQLSQVTGLSNDLSLKYQQLEILRTLNLCLGFSQSYFIFGTAMSGFC